MNSRWVQKRSFQGVIVVEIDLELVNEPGNCQRCSVVTAVGRMDRRIFEEQKYPKEHSAQIGQIDCKAVPSVTLVVLQAEHLVGSVAIVVVLVVAVG